MIAIKTWTFVTLFACTVYGQRKPPNYQQNEMPATSFSCKDKIVGGYYADPETSCQMFHVCVNVVGSGIQDFRFLCPNDTAFDQENQICDDWYNIDCEAATLYYSDNFDLYRIGSGAPAAGASKVTPIPLGPSSAAPAKLNQPKPANSRKPSLSAPVNNAVSENDDDYYLQRSDATDSKLQHDLLRGSSSGNFFSNKNRGVENSDDYEDTSTSGRVAASAKDAPKPQKNGGGGGKAPFRKLLTGKKPVAESETAQSSTIATSGSSSTTAAAITTTVRQPVYKPTTYRSKDRGRVNYKTYLDKQAKVDEYDFQKVKTTASATAASTTTTTTTTTTTFPSVYKQQTATRANNVRHQPVPYQSTQANVLAYTQVPLQQQTNQPKNNDFLRINNNGFQPANNGFQQANNGFQQANNGFQPANNGFQQANNGFQQANNGFQSANNGFQQANNGFQPANNNNFQSARINTVPNNNNFQGNNNNNNFQGNNNNAVGQGYQSNQNFQQQANFNQATAAVAAFQSDKIFPTTSQQQQQNPSAATTAAYQSYPTGGNTQYVPQQSSTQKYAQQTPTSYQQSTNVAFQSPASAVPFNGNSFQQQQQQQQQQQIAPQQFQQFQPFQAASSTTERFSKDFKAKFDPYNSYHQRTNDEAAGETLRTASSSHPRPSDLNALQQASAKPKTINATLSVGYSFNRPDVVAKSTVIVPAAAPTTQKPRPFATSSTTAAAAAITSTTTITTTAAAAATKTAATDKKPATKDKDSSYDYAYYDDTNHNDYSDVVAEDFSRIYNANKF